MCGEITYVAWPLIEWDVVSRIQNKNQLQKKTKMEFLIRLLFLSQSIHAIRISNHRGEIVAKPNPSLDPCVTGGVPCVPFWSTLREKIVNSDANEIARTSCLNLCNKHEYRTKISRSPLEKRLCSTAVYQNIETTPAFVKDVPTWKSAKNSIGDCNKFNEEIRPCCQWIWDHPDPTFRETLCPMNQIESSVIAQAYDFKMSKHTETASGQVREGGSADAPPLPIAESNPADNLFECDPATGTNSRGMPCVVS